MCTSHILRVPFNFCSRSAAATVHGLQVSGQVSSLRTSSLQVSVQLVSDLCLSGLRVSCLRVSWRASFLSAMLRPKENYARPHRHMRKSSKYDGSAVDPSIVNFLERHEV